MPASRNVQAIDRRDAIYASVPSEQRVALSQAVDKLIAAEKAGDWKTVYALNDKRPEGEAAFIDKMKRVHALREFQPSKVTFIPPEDHWSIQGCALFAGDRGKKGHIANIVARWEDSRWYLSVLAFILFGTEKAGKLQECDIE